MILSSLGQKAPEFYLQDEKGNEWRLSDQIGQVVAILFYPKGETLVCTQQLCSLRENWSDYIQTKAKVVGVSPGTIQEHREFANKYILPLPLLPLLVDNERKITRKYSKDWFFPKSFTRAIIIVDAKGFVRTNKIMLRSFRHTDNGIITAKHAARADALYENYDAIARRRNQFSD